jgi:hypothetical protein
MAASTNKGCKHRALIELPHSGTFDAASRAFPVDNAVGVLSSRKIRVAKHVDHPFPHSSPSAMPEAMCHGVEAQLPQHRRDLPSKACDRGRVAGMTTGRTQDMNELVFTSDAPIGRFSWVAGFPR